MIDFENDVKEHILAVKDTFEYQIVEIKMVVQLIINAINRGNKILFFGNGGSAADAQHVAAEFTNRFEIERKPLPAIALTTDTSALTAIGNDYSFDQIFSKQIEAIGKEGDIAIGISTSGNSPNVSEALKIARERKLRTVLFTGNHYIEDSFEIDVIMKAQSKRTATIQEVHIFVWHMICKAIDYNFKVT